MNKTNFANGFNNFCGRCGHFFAVRVDEDIRGFIKSCPICADENIIFTVDELLDHLQSNDTDPINFYKAFPPDEPIPNSRTGATPRQVANILQIVTQRHDIPLTIESVAGNCEITQEIVRKVFEELHITEKP